MQYLYRYETKGIQNWILDSNRMRDLAGGSMLVEALTQEAEQRAKTLSALVLQSTSGSMTARFPDKTSLESFASEWPMYLAGKAPGLQLVQAWVEADLGSKKLFEKLAARRNTVQMTEVEVGPWVLRAGRSGLPAVPIPADVVGKVTRTRLDAQAIAKAKAYNEKRESEGQVTGGYKWAAFDDDTDRWGGPVAVIHADGSGVGERLATMGDDLQAFSAALLESTREATRAAVDSLPKGGKIRARPIVAAGDDLTYLVPAAEALGFAEVWLQAFERETRARKAVGPLVGGAGIAIVHAGFPFAQAYHYAEKLCKRAKDQLKSRGETKSVLAFRRITTSLVDDIYRGGLAWTVDPDVQSLTHLVNTLEPLPRGSLRKWLTFFEQNDTHRANQLWDRAREVADARAWTEFEHALEGIGASGGQLNGSTRALRLDPTPEARATPISDALTLAQLLRKAQ